MALRPLVLQNLAHHAGVESSLAVVRRDFDGARLAHARHRLDQLERMLHDERVESDRLKEARVREQRSKRFANAQKKATLLGQGKP